MRAVGALVAHAGGGVSDLEGRILALPASMSAGLYSTLEVSHCYERWLVRPEKAWRLQEELARDLDPETLGIISIARDPMRLMRGA